MTTIVIRQRREKSFKDISVQCERIFTLHINGGFGTNEMFHKCETLYFEVLKKNGGY